jgi:hypothetical protein
MRLLSVLALATVLFASCNSSKRGIKNLDATAFIELETTPCFGTCPTYNMKLFADGKASFNGRQYSKKQGDYIAVFSEEEVEKIFSRLLDLKVMDRPDAYDDPRVTDLPSNILTFFDGSSTKTIRCRFDIPEDMLAFIKEIRALAESTEVWTAKDNM